MLQKDSTRPRRKLKDKKIAAANPGGPQPRDTQTGDVQVAAVQAAAAQPGVGQRVNPGKSLLKKGFYSLILF